MFLSTLWERTVQPKCIQTPSTFLTLSQFIRYSWKENGIKYDNNSELNWTNQNKIILIMLDYFDRKACNGLQSTKNYSTVKFKFTIRLYKFSSTNYQAMLNFVQSVV